MNDTGLRKIPIEQFPYPVGTVLQGRYSGLFAVAERDGHAFLACCTLHERQGKAFGWFPQHRNGEIVAPLKPSDADLSGGCGRG